MPDHPLSFLVNKLRTRSPFDQAAEEAILALPYTIKCCDPPAYLIRDGSIDLSTCSVVVSGYAFRQKLTEDGARQIVSLHMRGDMLDLQHLFFKRADHNVQALSRLETANISRPALRQVILNNPTVGRAIWADALAEASIYRDWITNVGRRDAKARVVHLLCEFATRMKFAGLGDGQSCILPMTQEQLGDAVGLTGVHVNRTLKALEQGGIIQRNRRQISFSDWAAVRTAGDFSANYLHFEQADWTETENL